jgi:hypothetical protein
MDDDFRSLQGNDQDEDLFAAFSSTDDDPFSSLDALTGDSDPFASLDALTGADDPFAGLGGPPVVEESKEPTLASSPTISQPFFDEDEEDTERPEWLRELSGFEDGAFDEPAVETPLRPKPTSGALTRFVGRGPRGMAFGMTAQQRMVLSIFLFLDMAVIGFLILYVIGAINL